MDTDPESSSKCDYNYEAGLRSLSVSWVNLEHNLHYFLGRNEKSISYIDNVGEGNYRTIDESMGIMKQFEANSKLIFMLSEIVGEHYH